MKTCRQERVHCQASVADVGVGVAETELVVGGVGGVGSLASSDEGSAEGVEDPAEFERLHVAEDEDDDVDDENEKEKEEEQGEGPDEEEDDDEKDRDEGGGGYEKGDVGEVDWHPGGIRYCECRKLGWAEGLDCQAVNLMVVEGEWV